MQNSACATVTRRPTMRIAAASFCTAGPTCPASRRTRGNGTAIVDAGSGSARTDLDRERFLRLPFTSVRITPCRSAATGCSSESPTTRAPS